MNKTIEDIINDPAFPEGSAWKRYDFKAQKTIICEGEEGRSLFYIEAGTMRVTGKIALDEKRTFQTGISELIEGDIFGEVCLYKSQVRTATVSTLSSGRLVEIDGESLNLYLDDHPVLGYLFLKDLFEILITRLDRANHRVEDLFSWGLKVHSIE